jgi:octaprenyl-diphosphate synthase
MHPSTITFDQVVAPVANQVRTFEDRFSAALSSDVEKVQIMSRYLHENRGKHFRPVLALLSAQSVGECSADVVEAAVGIEILQTGTLIHDDVLDSADIRRGADGLHVKWGNHAAILMGDFMLVKAMEILVGLRSLDVMEAATRAIRRMIEGEILEDEKGSDGELSIYFTMINKKTASLYALACEVGALLGGGSEQEVQNLASFGNDVGMAFQITDDLLDFIGDEETLGKPVGNDIREKKLTLPIIRALRNCENGEADQIHRKVLMGVQTNDDWQEVRAFVERYGGIELAREEARRYVQSAEVALEAIAPSEATEALKMAVNLLVDRQR